jgi:thiamine kinase
MDARIQSTSRRKRVTSPMAPEVALARIPGWDGQQRCQEIGDGLTNRSYLVRAKGADFVLRLDTEHARTLGLNRSVELAIWREAAKADVAPEVVFADPDAGILLYEYLPAPVWRRSSLNDPQNLRTLAELLRRVHALPPSGEPIDLVAAASRYAFNASENASLASFAAHCVSIVKEIPAPTLRCCCHNDVVAGNIVGTFKLKLLDWEYACDNDPFFDLASVVAYHDLKAGHIGWLLDAYTGGRDPEAKERLELQIRLYDAVQWLWLAVRYVVAPRKRYLKRLDDLQRRIK